MALLYFKGKHASVDFKIKKKTLSNILIGFHYIFRVHIHHSVASSVIEYI